MLQIFQMKCMHQSAAVFTLSRSVTAPITSPSALCLPRTYSRAKGLSGLGAKISATCMAWVVCTKNVNCYLQNHFKFHFLTLYCSLIHQSTITWLAFCPANLRLCWRALFVSFSSLICSFHAQILKFLQLLTILDLEHQQTVLQNNLIPCEQEEFRPGGI